MRISSSRSAVAALFVGNLYPLVGVLFLGWSVRDLLLLYWAESGIIGFYNLLRMASARGDENGKAALPGPVGCGAKAFFLGFFTIHFGIFMFVHGMFLLFLTSGIGKGGRLDFEGLDLPLSSMIPGLLFLLASHGWSFYRNWIVGEEFRTATLKELMARPYGRIVVMHLTIILGFFFLFLLGSASTLAVLLVILKTVADLIAHKKEHREARPPAAVSRG